MMKEVLQSLRQRGYAPRTMLDIGAHIGTFTYEFLGIFPGCVPTMIEPNPFCQDDLAKLGFEQHAVAASNEAGIAEMFLSKEWLQSTGSSLYRENTQHFRDEVTFKKEVAKVRLDDLFAGRKFDFVKIDTQGSEVDVILGAPKLLSQADYILVEVSLVEYNLGGARAEALFSTLDQLGFHPVEVTDFHRLAGVHNGNLIQIDFLFERRGLSIQSAPSDLDGLRALALSLHQGGRSNDALLLLNHLEAVQPGHIETLKLRTTVLGALGQTLQALQALAALRNRSSNVEELLGAIREQMPAALQQFNTHAAAGEVEIAEHYIAAMAALLPGNEAVLDSALSCNIALGRPQHVHKYASALLELNANHASALASLNRAPANDIAKPISAPANRAPAPHKKTQRAKGRK